MKSLEQTAQQALGDEVLRKIGRNLLLFQQIESLLKLLLANRRVQSTADGLTADHERRRDRVQKQMMGLLVEQYVDDILSDAGEAPPEPTESTVLSITSTFSISGDREFCESQRVNMKLMVDERNDLVHHFLPRWRPDSLNRLTDAASYLDKQREKILPMLEHLKSVSESMRNAHKNMADFLASEECERHLELLFLQNSSLITLLRDIASQIRRPDGWAYLAQAGKLVRIHERDAVENMKERYGHGTLKELLVASDLFDLFDEPLPSGGFRTLYRVRQECN